MVKNFGQRPIYRFHDGLRIEIDRDEWPSDVPLLASVTVNVLGDGPFHNYWRTVFLPDMTVEITAGWWSMPESLDEVLKFYEVEMRKLGWELQKSYRFSERRASVEYCHPETQVKVSMSFQRWDTRNETTALISRTLKHPYTPPVAEDEQVEENVEPVLDEVTK